MLGELGFDLGCIVEAIIVTRNPDSSPNAAPMGVTRTAPSILEIKPFKTSRTYRNLISTVNACVNITDDPELFLVTGFKDDPELELGKPMIDDKLTLEQAAASIFVSIVSYHDVSEDRGTFKCRVNSVEVHHPFPWVFSRGRAEAMEAIVHATRIKEHLLRGNLGDAEKLYKRFIDCRVVVERVSASGSKEMRVIRALETMMGSWREKRSR